MLSEKVLKKEDEAVVMRNQDVLFVALTPKRYQEIYPGASRKERIARTIQSITKLRKSHSTKADSMTASEFVSKMRDERADRWKR